MAMFNTIYCGLCVFFVVFLNKSSAFSNHDYNFYEVDSYPREASLNLNLINVKHNYRKRSVTPLPKLSQTNQDHVVPSSESPPSTVPSIDRITVNTVKQKTGRQLDTPKNDGVANLTLEQNVHKNLGENGTGIRNLNITTTLTPTLLDRREDPSDDGDSAEDPPDPIDTQDQSFNETLKNHNITSSRSDTNAYYNSTIITEQIMGQYYWVNLTDQVDVKVHDILSGSHRRAATVKLSFEFPFYGHLIKNVTIATGGFLYTGDYVHSWLAATQYIAPLMANFDTGLSHDSCIRYHDNGTAFTVEWDKVALQDRPKDGQFSFQVTLNKNGDIIFVYKNVPILIDQIKEHLHPVKVGLSDAYIMDQTVFLVRRKTIYEYDRVQFNKTEIRNWTAIYLKALPTCHDFLDCTSCLMANITKVCFWCPTSNKCSSGQDRNRQEWVSLKCDKLSYLDVKSCRKYISRKAEDDISVLPNSYAGQVIYDNKNNQVGVSGIIAIIFLVGMTSGIVMWLFYAYRNPHTISGQILIRYRPSQWRWRRGEARYTAATIHM